MNALKIYLKSTRYILREAKEPLKSSQSKGYIGSIWGRVVACEGERWRGTGSACLILEVAPHLLAWDLFSRFSVRVAWVWRAPPSSCEVGALSRPSSLAGHGDWFCDWHMISVGWAERLWGLSCWFPAGAAEPVEGSCYWVRRVKKNLPKKEAKGGEISVKGQRFPMISFPPQLQTENCPVDCVSVSKARRRSRKRPGNRAPYSSISRETRFFSVGCSCWRWAGVLSVRPAEQPHGVRNEPLSELVHVSPRKKRPSKLAQSRIRENFSVFIILPLKSTQETKLSEFLQVG